MDAEPNDAPVIVVKAIGWSGAACPTVQILIDGQSFGVLKDQHARYLPVTAGVHRVAVKVSYMRSRTLVLTLEPGDRISLECGLRRWRVVLPFGFMAAAALAAAFMTKLGMHEEAMASHSLGLGLMVADAIMTFAIPGARFFLRQSEADLDAGVLGRPGRDRRGFQFGLRGLLILVACCAPLFWVGRELWDRRPGNRPARAVRILQSGGPGERQKAASDLQILVIQNSLTPKQADAAIPGLLVALRDRNPGVREAAANCLGTIVFESVQRSVPVPRVPELAAGLAEGLRDTAADIRGRVGLTLATMYVSKRLNLPLPVDIDRFVDSLGQAIEDPSPQVREYAFHVLSAVGPRLKRAAPTRLLTALNAPDSAIREEALRTVVEFRVGIDSALPALLRVLEFDPDPEVRWWCSIVLKDVRPTPACTPLLMATLRSPERSVRFRAADLLSRTGPQASEAVPAVLPLLKETFDPVTSSERQNPESADPAVAATWALGAIAPGTDMADLARESLEEYLRQPGRPWGRRDAEWALDQLNPSSTPKSSDVKAKSLSQ